MLSTAVGQKGKKNKREKVAQKLQKAKNPEKNYNTKALCRTESGSG